ncbi:MAG TPA: hypothetical protein VGS22_28090 [Thermoanaerobaculia bacterium]|jgi:hypothetical protein|nr:hypothetical protein [Thermoanaerobaculia bacterium]
MRRATWLPYFRTAFLILAFLLSGRSAGAVICSTDATPAATLLLPYFEVDLGDPQGIDTLFSINNASALGVLAHVVLWTDVSVPTLDFNVYLTGYDAQTISLRDIFSGTAPRTASAGQDPGDTISPRGPLSQDVDFASCTGQLPPPPIPPSFLTHLRAAHTGKFSAFFSGCSGLAFGDAIARGYVTVDVVNNCTLRFPGDAGYFASGGTGDATDQNVLWGDYFMVTGSENSAQGDNLVHIEASATNPETSTPGQYTFYGRYVNWTAADNREPLATNFAVRYQNGGAFSGGTDLLVWRDSKVDQNAFKCGTLPSWYPLGAEMILLFDEEENLTSFPISSFSPQPPPFDIIPFPAETGRIRIKDEESPTGPYFVLPVNADFGWTYLNLNTTVGPAGNNPPEDSSAAQAWVSVISRAEGRFSVGYPAARLDDACDATHVVFLPTGPVIE